MGTRRTSLGKFYPFPNSGGGIKDGAQSEKEKTGKKAWGRPSGWNAKIRILSFIKRKKIYIYISRSQTPPLFLGGWSGPGRLGGKAVEASVFMPDTD